jgi:hypothetical protein
MRLYKSKVNHAFEIEEGNSTSLKLCSDTKGVVLTFFGTDCFFLPQSFNGVSVSIDGERDANGLQSFQLRCNGDNSEYYILAESVQQKAKAEKG